VEKGLVEKKKNPNYSLLFRANGRATTGRKDNDPLAGGPWGDGLVKEGTVPGGKKTLRGNGEGGGERTRGGDSIS